MKSNLENKRVFKKPEAEVIRFEDDLATDDIITASGDFGNTNPGSGDVFPKGWW